MSQKSNPNLIKAVILDIDGVLTDGRIGYGAGSDQEIKFFDVKDGAGIKMLQRAGIKVGFISGRESAANARRAKELALDFTVQNCTKKTEGLKTVTEQLGITPAECLYIGDDFIDASIMAVCGIAVAVGDAVSEIKNVADWTCDHNGGRGAVREVAVWLLKQQDKWEQTLQHYGM